LTAFKTGIKTKLVGRDSSVSTATNYELFGVGIEYLDEQGHTHKTLTTIMRVFTTHFRRKYDAIAVEDRCIDAMADAVPQPHTTNYAELLKQPIDTGEIRHAVLAGRRNKTLGVMGSAWNFTK
jgi:hypothetical protein